MARVRVPSVVVSFPSTEAALACEDVCERRGLAGRLIPLPGEISAGCGLAWKAAPELREALADALDAEDVAYEAMTYVCLLEFVREGA